jgi:hypothetical protein
VPAVTLLIVASTFVAAAILRRKQSSTVDHQRTGWVATISFRTRLTLGIRITHPPGDRVRQAADQVTVMEAGG